MDANLNKISGIINNSAINDWLTSLEHSDQLSRAIKADARKPYLKENFHKYILALTGVFLFPLLNIVLSHNGLLTISDKFRLGTVAGYIISLLIPLFLEFAQYATIKPLMKKIVKKNPVESKDYLDVIFFTLLILILTIIGIMTISERINTTFVKDYRLIFALSIGLFLSFMTIYSHKSLSGYFHKSVKEFAELHPEYINHNFIEFSNLSDKYKLALMRLNKAQFLPLEQSINEPVIQIAENKKEPVIIEKKPQNPIGFQFVKDEINENSNDNSNENRNNTKENHLRICKHCNNQYIYKHHKQLFCSTDCRIKHWETKTGKKIVKK